jgi:hypothetical protein
MGAGILITSGTIIGMSGSVGAALDSKKVFVFSLP